MARRSDHSKDVLKEMAITAAEQMIIKDGITGISARKVATAMGYTAGTLYLLFKNIDALIVEVNTRTLIQLEANIQHSTAQQDNPTDVIQSIAQSYFSYALEHTERWLALFEHRLPEGMALPEHHQAQINRLFALIEAPIRNLHGPNIAQAEITKEARALWAGVHGLATLTIGEKMDSSAHETIGILKLLIDRITTIPVRGQS